MTEKRIAPEPKRIGELVQILGDSNLEPGPLDREDLLTALDELVELRARYAYEQGTDVPALKAAS